jgi:hypothetical protein
MFGSKQSLIGKRDRLKCGQYMLKYIASDLTLQIIDVSNHVGISHTVPHLFDTPLFTYLYSKKIA